jgi:hypothetical protein
MAIRSRLAGQSSFKARGLGLNIVRGISARNYLELPRRTVSADPYVWYRCLDRSPCSTLSIRFER